jgi:hypothetical protein
MQAKTINQCRPPKPAASESPPQKTETAGFRRSSGPLTTYEKRRTQDISKRCGCCNEKPHETRADQAIAYPSRKRQAWQSDFGGVVRLSESRQLFWINIWDNRGGPSQHRHFALSLKAKDGSGKLVRCQLRDSQGRYVGRLELPNGVRYEISIQEDAGYLRVHFEHQGGVE